MKATAFGALALTLLVAACSQSTQSTSSSSSAMSSSAAPAAAATNPIDFPLGDGATVLHTSDFHAAAKGQSVSGTEVVAESSQSLSDLETWLKNAGSKPPEGYTVSTSGSGIAAAHARAQAMGVDFETFSHAVNGKTHQLVVVVLDPTEFYKKAGPVLSVIGKYQMLPQSLRDPIDARVKAQTGYSVSEALDPSQPLGAALAAAKTLKDSGQRGVVLVDAAKE
jgi:hypothetical protein